MNLQKKNLLLSFLLALGLTLLVPVIAPTVRLLFFAPCLIICYYQKSFSYSLWTSFFCGLFIDLLSMQSPFGFYACNYILTTAILYSQKRNFFADHIHTLPIMTFFFSIIITLTGMVFLYIFGNPVSLNAHWVFSDLLAMSGLDALYAFLCFILIPMSLQKQTRRSY